MSPVTAGTEAPGTTAAVWRFRLLLVGLLLVAVVATVAAYQVLTGAYDDAPVNPGIPRALPPAAAPLTLAPDPCRC